MIQLAKRGFLIYGKDKAGVLFSMLSSLIIFLLFLLFIGDTITEGVSSLKGVSHVEEIAADWMAAGMLSAAAITSSMGAYAVMVSDKESRREKDFLCAPLKGWEITGGYLLPGMAVSFLMSLVTLVFVCLYLAVSGFSLPRAGLLLPLAGIMLLTSFAASAMTCFITSFLKTVNAYTTVSILLGTLTGFLLGAYVNIGSLPSGVQTLIRFFPLSHSAVLYRQLLMQDALDRGFASFSGPWQEIFCENMGVTYAVNGSPMQPWMHLCVLAATGAAFYALALLRLSFAARHRKGN